MTMTRRILLLLMILASSLAYPLDAAASSASAAIQAQQSSPADVATFTLADLGESDITVRQLFDLATVEFPFPAGLKVDKATLTLHMSYGKKLLAEVSDLAIGLNNEPIADVILSPDQADNLVLPLEVPRMAFLPGKNILRFSFDLRLVTDGCADVGSPDLWATIYADTRFEVSGHFDPLELDISHFPAPFTTFSTLSISPRITFVLPDAPQSAELTAASRLAAALGQDAQWQSPPLRAITASQVASQAVENDHLIVVSLGDRNPLAAAASAGLTELVSPFNSSRLMLVLKAGDESKLLQAADWLATRSARGLLPNHASTPVLTFNSTPSADRPTRQSFTELGFSDDLVRGIGPHDLYYPIDIPYDWKTTSDASIELHYTHVRNLSTNSLLRVYVNSKKVSDFDLTNFNARDGRLIIQLSPRQIHPGRNWLHLNVTLNLPGENCRYRYFDETWLKISAAASIVNLAHVKSQPPLELLFLPSPMVTPQDLSGDLFVLPEQPGTAELTALVQVSAKLGTYSKADALRPAATTAGTYLPVTIASRADSHQHIIAIGVWGNNSLLTEVDQKLPQPLALISGAVDPALGRQLLPEEQTATGSQVPAAGYLELLYAPWQRNSSLIVISGYDEAGLLRVVEALPTLGTRVKSKGNVAVISPTGLTGMSLAQIPGTAFSGASSAWMAFLLMGIFILISLVSWWVSKRQKRPAETDTSDDEGLV